MSVARFTQNFSHRRALLVSADKRAVDALSVTLVKLGLTVEMPEARADLDPARDIVLVDGDLSLGASAFLQSLADPLAVPVVGLVGVEAPSRLKGLMQLGATAFLQKPIYGGSVYSALFLAVNEHARKRDLATAVEELETRRRLRRYVIKAVVTTMQRNGLDDDAAFQLLRREAMRDRLGLETFCERLVLARTEPRPDRPPGLSTMQAGN